MVTRFDWSLVPSFLAVLDAGSLSAAARASGISQPALTRHIAELEQVLGVLLFERGREGARPPHAGLAIAAAAERMAEDAGAIALAAAGASEAVSGTVRITASEVVATWMLPQFIASLLGELPGLSVELVPSNDVQNLLRHDADIAVRMIEPEQLDLVSRRLGEFAMGIYARADYLERRGTPRFPAELRDHVVVGYDRSDLVLRGFRALGHEVDRDFFRFRCDDQVAAFEAVRAGVGVGFAPVWLASRYPELRRIAADIAIPSLPVWLVTHREMRTSSRIRAVFDHMTVFVSRFCQ